MDSSIITPIWLGVLALTLVWCIFNSTIDFRLKIAISVVFFLSTFATLNAYTSFRGYPSSDTMNKVELVAIDVRRPIGDYKGAIYIWGYETEENRGWNPLHYNAPEKTPRAYFMPYTEENEKAASKMMSSLESKTQKTYVSTKGQKGNKQSGGDAASEDSPVRIETKTRQELVK